MSDVLDIESRYGSEFGDESDMLTNSLKKCAKNKKGRGFIATSTPIVSEKGNLKMEFPVFESFCSLEHPQKSVEGFIIFVSGIHDEATEEDIKDIFSEYGKISNFALNLDRRTGFIKGYAIIEYKTYDEAAATIENLNDSLLLGQTVKVNWAFIKKPKRGHLNPSKQL